MNYVNSYTRVCPPVRGDNPRALASISVLVDKPWYYSTITLSSHAPTGSYLR